MNAAFESNSYSIFTLMKSILLPTDFLPASYNAAQYAIAFAKQFNSTEIILYNSYMAILPDNPETANFIIPDAEELRSISDEGLKKFKSTMENENTAGIEFKTISDYNTIKNGIIDTGKEQNVELIIMYVSTIKDKIDEVLIGSTALSVAKESEIPVLILPEEVSFKHINRILFACDLKKVRETTPVDSIKKILDVTKASLFVLHVEADANDFKGNLAAETLTLDDLLGGYNPEYVYAEDKDFNHAINRFVTNNNIDLVITIPKKHGWFEGIFKHSHTKDLAFHTQVPLLAIHEKS